MLISISFTLKTSHSCLKKMVHYIFQEGIKSIQGPLLNFHPFFLQFFSRFGVTFRLGPQTPQTSLRYARSCLQRLICCSKSPASVVFFFRRMGYFQTVFAAGVSTVLWLEVILPKHQSKLSNIKSKQKVQLRCSWNLVLASLHDSPWL